MATKESSTKKGKGGAGKARTRASGNGRTKNRPDDATLVGLYRTMFAARRTDDKEIGLKRQNKIFYQI